MTEVLADKVKEQAEKQIPMQRFGQVEDIAQTAVFLAQNPYITGQVINVDGGLVMHKAKDADNLEQAFREFTAKTLSKEQRPSIRKVLAAAKQKAAQQPKRAKERIKQRGLER